MGDEKTESSYRVRRAPGGSPHTARGGASHGTAWPLAPGTRLVQTLQRRQPRHRGAGLERPGPRERNRANALPAPGRRLPLPRQVRLRERGTCARGVLAAARPRRVLSVSAPDGLRRTRSGPCCSARRPTGTARRTRSEPGDGPQRRLGRRAPAGRSRECRRGWRGRLLVRISLGARPGRRGRAHRRAPRTRGDRYSARSAFRPARERLPGARPGLPRERQREGWRTALALAGRDGAW